MSTDGSQYGSGGSAVGLDASASQSHPAAADPMLGQVLDGRYRIIAKLGEGGMGEVYAAEHVHIEKRVAVKLLRSEIVTNQEAVTRFRQEARSASSIGHKNIIAIEDFGSLPDGRIYLCMELLDGQPLNDMIQQPIETGRLLDILIQTGHGLAAAHAKGIVHRDMKPENIFVTRGAQGESVPKLLDFGIAKVSGNDGNNHLTRTGTIFGTPFYMAPEQALGQQVDHRADVYAMGVIMYEVFCGDVPFQGESFMGILTQHITAEPKPPAHAAAERGRTIPPGIEPIILRAMKKEPDQRFATMDELVQELVKVYRGYEGPGMSVYMQAHVPPPSRMMSAAHHPATPQDFGRAETQAAPSAQMPVAHAYTPMPMTPPPGDSLSELKAVKKGKAGIIVAILAVLAVVGGGAAFLVISQSEAKEVADGTGGGERGNGADNSGGTTAGGGTSGAEGAGTQNDPPDLADETTDTDTDGDEADVVEDEEVHVVEARRTDGATAGGDVASIQLLQVLVNSVPQNAQVFQGDDPLGRTPLIVKVIPGEPVDIRLEKSGYEAQALTLDGKTDRFDLRLSKRRSTSSSSSSGKGSSSTSGGKTDTGKTTTGKTDAGKTGTSGTGTGTGTADSGKGDSKGTGKGNSKDTKDKRDPNVLEDGVLGDPASMLE